MTVKLFATGVAAVVVIGVASVAPAMTSGDPAAVQVQPVVFAVPLPLEPPPAPAPPQPEPPALAPESAPGAALPTTDEVAGLLTKLTDAGISYKEKENLVENGITSQEGHGLDHDLRKAYRDGELPYTFNVLNVSPTVPDQAVANVTVSGPKIPVPQTKPVTLVDQGGWVLTHDSAVALVQELASP